MRTTNHKRTLAGLWRGLFLAVSLLAFFCIGLTFALNAQTPEEAPTGLEVHFLDVGQGDCILIRLPDEKLILIDGGERRYGPAIVSYLRGLGIDRIDYLVATHPHADHIGGLPDVIEAFPIDTILMPRTTHTTQTYERLLTTIRDQGLRITEAVAGDELFDSGRLRARIVAPQKKQYEKLNDFSVVLHLQYGSTAFLFTGDAEETSEAEMLRSGYPLNADVLKVAHHGSRTSSGKRFLEAVRPSIAVIQVGADNRYGHPTQEVLERLAALDATVYRTDTHGTVIVRSDGETLQVETLANGSPPSPTPAAPVVDADADMPALTPPGPGVVTPETDSPMVHVTPHGRRYHRATCRTIRDESREMTRQEAENQGYGACGVCKP